MLPRIILMQPRIIQGVILTDATPFAYTAECPYFYKGHRFLMPFCIILMSMCIKSIFSLSFQRSLQDKNPNITGFPFRVPVYKAGMQIALTISNRINLNLEPPYINFLYTALLSLMTVYNFRLITPVRF